jgi:hypothetical protein
LDKHLQTIPTDDSLGAQLKAGLAQFLALEFTELNKCKDRDSRSIVKYLPWLNNLPSNAQQGYNFYLFYFNFMFFYLHLFKLIEQKSLLNALIIYDFYHGYL